MPDDEREANLDALHRRSAALGQVVEGSALLEFQVLNLLCSALSPDFRRSMLVVANQPMSWHLERLKVLCAEALQKTDPGLAGEFDELLDRSRKLMGERNALVHGMSVPDTDVVFRVRRSKNRITTPSVQAPTADMKLLADRLVMTAASLGAFKSRLHAAGFLYHPPNVDG